ncbi:RNase P/RNase MRP complex subunit [Thecaphora frezii]
MDPRHALPAPCAEKLLSSVLQASDASFASSSRPSSSTHAHYLERLKDRRVQLSNPDRRRPAAGGSTPQSSIIAESKLAARKRRVKMELAQMKRMRIQTNKQLRHHDAHQSHAAPSKHHDKHGQQDKHRVKQKQAELANVKKDLIRERRRCSHGAKTGNRGKKLDKSADKPLTRSQRKRLGLEEVDDNVGYDLMLPLHRMWCSYIQQLLNLTVLDAEGKAVPNPHFQPANLANVVSNAVAGMQGSLVKADLCGALVEVVRSSNPSLVHLSGLVVKETERTLIIAPRPHTNSTTSSPSPSPSPSRKTRGMALCLDSPSP